MNALLESSGENALQAKKTIRIQMPWAFHQEIAQKEVTWASALVAKVMPKGQKHPPRAKSGA